MNFQKIFAKTSFFLVLITGIAFAGAIPSDVSGVTIVAGDSEATLSWDPAKDEDGIIVNYKIYYGKNPISNTTVYDSEKLTQSADTTYTIDGLENETTYYFALTALDNEDNESENYSIEVVTMPQVLDTTPPSLISAQQTKINTVVIEMSEPVIARDRDAFSILLVGEEDAQPLNINNIEIEKEKVTLIIQDPGLVYDKTYQVIADSLVEDAAGNPVSSGVTNKVEFVTNIQPDQMTICENDNYKIYYHKSRTQGEYNGKTLALHNDIVYKSSDRTDCTWDTTNISPKSISQSYQDNDLCYQQNLNSEIFTFNQLEVCVDIVEEEPDNTEAGIEIQDEIDKINTENLAPKEEEDINTTIKLETEEFFPAAPDTTPPLDVSNLEGKSIKNGTSIELTWDVSLDIDDDVLDQILFVKEGTSPWDDGISIGKDVDELEIKINPDIAYKIKIVTVDNNNNSSPGSLYHFTSTLTHSGPSNIWIIAAGVGLFLFGFTVIGARRQ